MSKPRTKPLPYGTWTQDGVVQYDLVRDLYWVAREFIFRVERVVGKLTPLKDRKGYALTQSQVDWLHDNGYIIA